MYFKLIGFVRLNFTVCRQDPICKGIHIIVNERSDFILNFRSFTIMNKCKTFNLNDRCNETLAWEPIQY